jgi:NAD(P)-dependent dehydrogenase (short-subunit alcohol dehydrogenase family)
LYVSGVKRAGDAERLKGKVAVVTGASSGIGLEIARALAAEGAAVIGFARRFPARAAAPPPSGQLLEVGLDVTDEAAVRARFAELGDVDILCCCAGIGTFAPIREARVEDLRAMLEVHIVGTFLPARELLLRRALAGPRPGHIISVSSSAALRTFTSCGGYSAAKEGQRGLTRVLVEEARALGVRVTGLYPGATDTPIWDERPGFDRAAMLRPAQLAELVVELVVRPELAVEELVVMPPAGAL